MSALLQRGSAILPYTPSATHVDKEGYLVDLAAGVATISASATVPAKGVILNGEATTGQSSVGILGCLPGTVKMKTSGIIAQDARVQQAADGTIVTDAGPGNARVVVGMAVEAGAAGDLIEVVPFVPMILP